jgi:hypothetical protein
MLSVFHKNQIEARRAITPELKGYVAATENVSFLTLPWVFKDCSRLTCRTAIEDYLRDNPEVLIGCDIGSDQVVLGKVVKKTDTSYKLSNGESIRWSDVKQSYMYKSSHYVNVNAVECRDPNF